MGLFSKIFRASRDRRARRAIAARLDRDPVAVAQILLLFRMMLADGVVDDKEMAVFRDICARNFGIRAKQMAALHGYLEERQPKGGAQAQDRLLKRMSMKERLKLIGLMGRIAAAGSERPAGPPEARPVDQRFIRDTAQSLGVSEFAHGR